MNETADALAKLTPAGRRILDVAANLFYRQGIHAVGVEAIAAEAGVTKKTLYACFGSKDQLVTVYLTERDLRWREWLRQWCQRHGLDGAGSAETTLLGTFDALAAWMDSDEFRGCGFVNALAELPAPDHPGHQVIVEHKRWMWDYFANLAEQAGVRSPHACATHVLLLYEGVIVAATTSVPDAARYGHEAASALLGA